VSDVVTRGEMLAEIRKSVLLGSAALRVLLKRTNTAVKLASAGFENIEIEPTQNLSRRGRPRVLSGQNIDVDAIAPQVDGKFMSAFVRAVKPVDAGAKTWLRTDLLPLGEGEYARTLQRLIPVHGQFRALDHGGGHT